ncbi:hypothetical protein [Bradyrhizobium cenepequi]|uniref:hypothetical protein n=1 Tax=Bradyrhizobium cenepequi TaxID=2821403 RepID=UPI001CE35314|nr:hypothetical protein [Bradyrhizobium cenepequi]MCA6112953.1 hypothetical protein [Bradyrhizobium cenepequi]
MPRLVQLALLALEYLPDQRNADGHRFVNPAAVTEHVWAEREYLGRKASLRDSAFERGDETATARKGNHSDIVIWFVLNAVDPLLCEAGVKRSDAIKDWMEWFARQSS